MKRYNTDHHKIITFKEQDMLNNLYYEVCNMLTLYIYKTYLRILSYDQRCQSIEFFFLGVAVMLSLFYL